MANCDKRKTVSVAFALALLAGCAVQSADRVPWAMSSGLHFVDSVVAADNYRAEAGGLAMKKSLSSELREFGRVLWEESTEQNSRLKWLLTKTPPGVVLPTQISPQYMFAIDELLPVSGDAFDRRFIAQQTASLRESLILAEGYARAGDNFDLKEFAARSVPRLKMQLDRIHDIEMKLP